MNRPTWDSFFLAIAHTVSTRSPCVKRRVGAVLVSDDKAVLATGYNGPPRGAPHRDEKTCVRIGIPSGTQGDVVCCAHAEINAIAQAARHGVPVKGSTLYVTTSPCAWCARSIINAGVVRVVRDGDYADPVAAGVFAESNVPVEQAVPAPQEVSPRELAEACRKAFDDGAASMSRAFDDRLKIIEEIAEQRDTARESLAKKGTELARIKNEIQRALRAAGFPLPDEDPFAQGNIPHTIHVATAEAALLLLRVRALEGSVTASAAIDKSERIEAERETARVQNELHRFIAEVDAAIGGSGCRAPEYVLQEIKGIVAGSRRMTAELDARRTADELDALKAEP